jgi:hypothetical protein
VEIIDTGAFELVKILQPALLDSSQGAIFVYDAFNRPSFRKLHDYYLPLFVSVSGGGAPITLVGNRTDKSAAVQVPAVEARELADKYGAAYFEIPATSSREVRRVVVNHIRNMRKARGRLPLVQQSQAPTHPRDQAKQSSAPAAIEAVAYQKQLLPPLSRFADKPDGQVQGRTYSQSELRSAFDEAETFTVWSFLSRWVCGIG